VSGVGRCSGANTCCRRHNPGHSDNYLTGEFIDRRDDAGDADHDESSGGNDSGHSAELDFVAIFSAIHHVPANVFNLVDDDDEHSNDDESNDNHSGDVDSERQFQRKLARYNAEQHGHAKQHDLSAGNLDRRDDAYDRDHAWNGFAHHDSGHDFDCSGRDYNATRCRHSNHHARGNDDDAWRDRSNDDADDGHATARDDSAGRRDDPAPVKQPPVINRQSPVGNGGWRFLLKRRSNPTETFLTHESGAPVRAAEDRPLPLIAAIVDGEIVGEALFEVDVIVASGAKFLGGDSPFAPEAQ
jgi:hypothetical protein